MRRAENETKETKRKRERDAKNTRRGMDGEDDKREREREWGTGGVQVGYGWVLKPVPRVVPQVRSGTSG